MHKNTDIPSIKNVLSFPSSNLDLVYPVSVPFCVILRLFVANFRSLSELVSESNLRVSVANLSASASALLATRYSLLATFPGR